MILTRTGFSDFMSFFGGSVFPGFTVLFTDIRAAVRTNVKPGIVLQLFALALVLSYYFYPPSRGFFDCIVEMKSRLGLIYSSLSTAFFGGLLPVSVLFLLGRFRGEKRLLRVAVIILFWLYKGVEVELFYRLQAYCFGSDPTVITVIQKVAFDQFVYNPILAAPSMIFFYLWIDSSFSFSAVREKTGKVFVFRTFPTVLISTWFVWIPATAIVYSLPYPLQLPVCNFILCFWVLIFDIVSKSGR